MKSVCVRDRRVHVVCVRYVRGVYEGQLSQYLQSFTKAFPGGIVEDAGFECLGLGFLHAPLCWL